MKVKRKIDDGQAKTRLNMRIIGHQNETKYAHNRPEQQLLGWVMIWSRMKKISLFID